ncbi:MAG: glutamate formimidoyltransferase [Candidatus Izemoplasmatales bacterium]|jgi:glutamate formiminotransferase|nr:glutamate formimidoyltransferase [Candidatus Izemoplasmatales bacterium]MDD4596305.1 glutamate formimidoyltransferase [Candidatus Izemoplasmatales bacterium]
MGKIVECVPNFSEGRDHNIIEAIIAPLKNKSGFKLVSYEPDIDYNRTVVTLIGDAEAIIEAIPEFVGWAVKLIDLNHHTGQHPRMGAVDVIPFIPLEDTTVEECVGFANTLAQIISSRFSIPVFMYALAARQPERVSLPNIRKGEFEGMKTKILDPLWLPDYGKPEIHPTFGAVAIGARILLVAYNIDIATKDEKVAERLARTIRQSSGGFQHIQAGPAYLEQRGHVQVTMNVLDYKKNPLYRIWETIKMEALRYHVEVTSAEIIGLIPKEALTDSLKYYYATQDRKFLSTISLDDIVSEATKYMQFRDLSTNKIIEKYLE